jgi:DNA gyrase/topoisomerase IV subunit A
LFLKQHNNNLGQIHLIQINCLKGKISLILLREVKEKASVYRITTSYHIYHTTVYLNHVKQNISMSKSTKHSKEDQKNLEKKLGEVLGLERAAQKAVDELNSMKLLGSSSKKEIIGMKDEANSHEEKIMQLISDISDEKEDLKISQDNIEETAKETEKKAVKMMKTYLGENPDSSEAIEFLALAEGGEVVHYEVLNAISKNFKVKELSNTISSILKEEQKHLQLCIDLAKESVS